MGRWARFLWGAIDFKEKFEFATQCSNLGHYLERAAKPLGSVDLYVSRYIGDDGEIVWIIGRKEDLVRALDRMLREMKALAVKGERCELCGSERCYCATVRMLEEFKKAVEQVKEDWIDAGLYIEYG